MKRDNLVSNILKLVIAEYWEGSRSDKYVLDYIDYALIRHDNTNQLEFE